MTLVQVGNIRGPAGPVTWPLRGPADTAAAPNFSFSASPGTGMYSRGANRLGFSSNDVDRWEISATGMLLAATSNAYDIGSSGSTNRPRHLYLAGAANVQGGVVIAPTVATGIPNYGINIYFRVAEAGIAVHPTLEKPISSAISASPQFSSTVTTAAYGYNAYLGASSGTFDVALMAAFHVETPVLGGTVGATTVCGLRIRRQGQARITNAYGVYIDAQSGATTLNIGLRNEGTTEFANHVRFTPDNTYDIGESGANRPRDIHVGRRVLGPDGSAAAPSYSFTTSQGLTGMYQSGPVGFKQVHLMSWGPLALGAGLEDIYEVDAASIRPNDIYAGSTALGGTINRFSRLHLANQMDMLEIAKPWQNPAAGSMFIYPKADRHVYALDSAGTETDLSSPLPFAQHVTFAPDNTWDIGESGANRPRDVFVGRQVLAANGWAAAPSYSFTSQPGTGMSTIQGSQQQQQLNFSTQGQLRLIVFAWAFPNPGLATTYRQPGAMVIGHMRIGTSTGVLSRNVALQVDARGSTVDGQTWFGTGTNYGAWIQPQFPQGTTSGIGIQCSIAYDSGMTGSVASTTGLAVAAPSGGLTNLTTVTGVSVANQGRTGVTNAYGIWIANQSGASSINLGLHNVGMTRLDGNIGVGRAPYNHMRVVVAGALPTTAGFSQVGLDVAEVVFTNAATEIAAITAGRLLPANATLTRSTGVHIGGGDGPATTTLQESVGLTVTNQGPTSGASIERAYGIRILPQHGADQVNVGLHNEGTTEFANHVRFTPDNTWDIGESAANRPRDVHVGRNIRVGDGVHANGLASRGAVWCENTYQTAPMWGYALVIPNSGGGSNGIGIAWRWDTYSSLAWKRNVKPIPEPLSLLRDDALHGVAYDHVDGAHSIGFVADYWQQRVPEVVGLDAEGNPASMDYARVGAITWEALKQYVRQTDARIAELEARLGGQHGRAN